MIGRFGASLAERVVAWLSISDCHFADGQINKEEKFCNICFELGLNSFIIFVFI